jgi:hypothetical protein
MGTPKKKPNQFRPVECDLVKNYDAGNESTQTLLNYVESLCYCACCEETETCIDGCTIKEDCERVGGSAMDAYNRMMEARYVLERFKEQARKEGAL